MTCDNISDGAYIPDDKHGAWQILAPLSGLYHVRGGHSAVLLRQAHDTLCRGIPHFIHFYLPALGDNPVPLNWVLSNRTACLIWAAFDNSRIDNLRQLTQLQEALAPKPPASDIAPPEPIFRMTADKCP